jgi:hypothetical protein
MYELCADTGNREEQPQKGTLRIYHPETLRRMGNLANSARRGIRDRERRQGAEAATDRHTGAKRTRRWRRCEGYWRPTRRCWAVRQVRRRSGLLKRLRNLAFDVATVLAFGGSTVPLSAAGGPGLCGPAIVSPMAARSAVVPRKKLNGNDRGLRVIVAIPPGWIHC